MTLSPGDVIDRLTILELKLARIGDAAKLANVRREHDALRAAHDAAILPDPQLDALRERLAAVNRRLWEAEDAVRDCERRQRFDDDFVQFARSIYLLNDERGSLKRDIDRLLGAGFHDEKSHALPDLPA